VSVTFGPTLFSLSNEWLAGSTPLTQLLERVAADGLGPDLELDGCTMFRGLPTPYAHEVETFRDTCERLGLRPTVFGVYVDRARRRDRWLTIEEGARDLEQQVRAARDLGFGLVRGAVGIDLAVIERVLPVLSALDVVLTLEVQGTMTPQAPPVTELADWLHAHDGAPVGLTFDTSVAMSDLPPSFREHLRHLGMSDAVEAFLDGWWTSDLPAHERFGGFRTALADRDVPPAVLDATVTAFVRMGHSAPADWRPLLPWVRHVHAKFWDADVTEEHVVGPQSRCLTELHEAGYAGSVSSEWGGSEWHGLEVDTFGLVGRHLDALRQVADLSNRPA
jgi:sugar phosphate isomerase/epimerase